MVVSCTVAVSYTHLDVYKRQTAAMILLYLSSYSDIFIPPLWIIVYTSWFDTVAAPPASGAYASAPMAFANSGVTGEPPTITLNRFLCSEALSASTVAFIDSMVVVRSAEHATSLTPSSAAASTKFAIGTSMPVSYTHLDVYKRQAHIRAF